MNDITTEEKKVVEELRKRTINDVTPKMLEDVSLFYRFAKARDFLLAEAEVMLRKHITWRKEMDIDTILTEYEPLEILVKYMPITFICFDKERRVVRYVDCGRVDPNGLWNSVQKPELAKYVAYVMEKDKELLIKKGRNLGKHMYSLISDFEDLTYANAMNIKSLQYVVYLLKMLIDNYPETIGRLTLINAPSYFAWVFSVIKPLTPKRVLQKIGIYGTDDWKDDLLELIDAADLPAFLGGARTDPDGNPRCETFIQRGRPVPRKYYKNKESKKMNLASGAERLTIKPLSKEEICFEVKEENSHLEWEFDTNNSDIDFSLHFKGGSALDFKPFEIIPKQRIEKSDGPQKGFINCEKAGRYIIVLDNSYSWFHSKEVHYRAGIKSPKDNELYR